MVSGQPNCAIWFACDSRSAVTTIITVIITEEEKKKKKKKNAVLLLMLNDKPATKLFSGRQQDIKLPAKV